MSAITGNSIEFVEEKIFEYKLQYSFQSREILSILTWSAFFNSLETSVKISDVVKPRFECNF